MTQEQIEAIEKWLQQLRAKRSELAACVADGKLISSLIEDSYKVNITVEHQSTKWEYVHHPYGGQYGNVEKSRPVMKLLDPIGIRMVLHRLRDAHLADYHRLSSELEQLEKQKP